MNILKDLYFKFTDNVEPLTTPETIEAQRQANKFIKERESEEATYMYALTGHTEGWIDGFRYAVNLLRACDGEGYMSND